MVGEEAALHFGGGKPIRLWCLPSLIIVQINNRPKSQQPFVASESLSLWPSTILERGMRRLCTGTGCLGCVTLWIRDMKRSSLWAPTDVGMAGTLHCRRPQCHPFDGHLPSTVWLLHRAQWGARGDSFPEETVSGLSQPPLFSSPHFFCLVVSHLKAAFYPVLVHFFKARRNRYVFGIGDKWEWRSLAQLDEGRLRIESSSRSQRM